MEDTISNSIRTIIREEIEAAFLGLSMQLAAEHREELDPPSSELPPLLSPRQLAEYLDLSTQSLIRWRRTWPDGSRHGPRFSRLPGSHFYRYSREDVLEWIDSGKP